MLKVNIKKIDFIYLILVVTEAFLQRYGIYSHLLMIYFVKLSVFVEIIKHS